MFSSFLVYCTLPVLSILQVVVVMWKRSIVLVEVEAETARKEFAIYIFFSEYTFSDKKNRFSSAVLDFIITGSRLSDIYLFHWLVPDEFINLQTCKDYCYPEDKTKEEGPMDIPASPGFWRKLLPFTYR